MGCPGAAAHSASTWLADRLWHLSGLLGRATITPSLLHGPGPPPLAPLLGPLHHQPHQLPPLGFAGPSAPPGWISHPAGFAWDPKCPGVVLQHDDTSVTPLTEWYMDTSAETHMTSNSGNLCVSQPPSFPLHQISLLEMAPSYPSLAPALLIFLLLRASYV